MENNKEEKAECSQVQVKPEEENDNNNKPGQFMNIMLKIIHSKLRWFFLLKNSFYLLPHT